MDSTVDIVQYLKEHRAEVRGNEHGVDVRTMVLEPNELHVHAFQPDGACRIRLRQGGVETAITIAFDDLCCFAKQLEAFIGHQQRAQAAADHQSAR